MAVMLRRFWIQITADRKRFWALCVVMAMGLLLWARLIIVSRPPRTAMANETAVLSGAKGSGSGSKQASGDGGASKPRSGAGGSGPVAAATARANRKPTHIELFVTPGHDPFVISPVHFPKPTLFTDTGKEPDKSTSEVVEEPQHAEARLTAQLRAIAAKLKLEASVGGSMAVISGRRYRQGEIVPGPGNDQVQFVLTEVKQRSVTLECEGRRFELEMASPGS